MTKLNFFYFFPVDYLKEIIIPDKEEASKTSNGP